MSTELKKWMETNKIVGRNAELLYLLVRAEVLQGQRDLIKELRGK